MRNYLDKILYPPLCSLCERVITEEPPRIFGRVLPAEGGEQAREPVHQACLCRYCASKLPLRLKAERVTAVQDFPTWATFYFAPPLDNMLLKLKFHGRTDFAVALAPYLAATVARRIGEAEVIVPLPLSPRREHERGYNQAALLAAAVSEILHIPLLPDLLVRWRETPRLSEANYFRRREYIGDSFRLDEASYSFLAGKRVILLDDTLATGATITAAGRVLQEAGIAVVAVVAAYDT